MPKPIIQIKNLCKNFSIKQASLLAPKQVLKAVKNVSLDVKKGEIFGIIGESGCGKSTLARTIVGIYKADSGTVKLDENSIENIPSKELNRTIQYVFQDPLGSLNPRETIRQNLQRPLHLLLGLNSHQINQKLTEMMEAVGLPLRTLYQYPHEISGGQAQRIGIARALLAGSQILVLDEPVSALDVSVQAQILELLINLKDKFSLTYIFISHDLAVIEAFCNRVAVMYYGEIAEVLPATKLYSQSLHPYTNLLARTAPRLDNEIHTEFQIELPDPLKPPLGCAFAPRCSNVGEACKESSPELKLLKENSYVACHYPTKQ